MSESRGIYSADKIQAVEIEGEIVKVQTMSNGLVRVTIDLQEYCMAQGQTLLGWTRDNIKAVIERANNFTQ
jgi:hypothetical protein